MTDKEQEIRRLATNEPVIFSALKAVDHGHLSYQDALQLVVIELANQLQITREVALGRASRYVPPLYVVVPASSTITPTASN